MSKATKDQQESKMVVCKMNNGCDNNEAASSASKLSKIGRRIRDSCRQHLRGKHPSGGASSNPEDYGSTPAPNVSQPFTKWPLSLKGSYRKVAGPCTMYRWTFREANPGASSAPKTCLGNQPKMATLITDGLFMSPRMLTIC